MFVAEMRREGRDCGTGAGRTDRVGMAVLGVFGRLGWVERGLEVERVAGVVRTAPAMEAWISRPWRWVPGPGVYLFEGPRGRPGWAVVGVMVDRYVLLVDVGWERSGCGMAVKWFMKSEREKIGRG